MRHTNNDSVTLHSTWTGIGLSYLGAIGLIGITVVTALSGAPLWVTIMSGVLSVLAVLVVVFDLPIATTFTAEGVTRHALGRRHHIPWSRITRVTRQRVGMYRTRKGSVGGGLVADVKGRKYALVDTLEGAQEFDTVRSVLGPDLCERLGVTPARRPPENQIPTWMHRRAHWRPEAK